MMNERTPFNFRKISHVGIVVKDLTQALESYSRGLGIEVEKRVEIPDVQLKIGVLKMGEVEIELLEYQNPDLPIAKPLRADRPGLNHICYEVRDFEEAMDRLKGNGFKLVEGFPRQGVHGRIAFFIPPHSPEERIEILETE